jgi:hypothetical protein
MPPLVTSYLSRKARSWDLRKRTAPVGNLLNGTMRRFIQSSRVLVEMERIFAAASLRRTSVSWVGYASGMPQKELQLHKNFSGT